MEKKNKLVNNIISFVLIIGLALLIKIFIFSPIKVNGDSMVPTLNDGDIMILNEIGYRFNGVERFDIVVAKVDGERYIKRIIGLPGEKLEYRNNELYIDDKLVVENFKHGDTEDFNIEEIGLDKIPENSYFIIGDNRGNSKDSRVIGAVHKSKIMGKTKLIVFPFDRVSTVQ